jgi:hypothetical protein
MSARIHALVQDPHNLDQVRRNRPVVDDMYWLPDAVRATHVPSGVRLMFRVGIRSREVVVDARARPLGLDAAKNEEPACEDDGCPAERRRRDRLRGDSGSPGKAGWVRHPQSGRTGVHRQDDGDGGEEESRPRRAAIEAALWPGGSETVVSRAREGSLGHPATQGTGRKPPSEASGTERKGRG